MDTVTVKTCELIGPALDWAVAKCEGATDFDYDGMACWFCLKKKVYTLSSGVMVYSPSAGWSQGGPIIEREIESLYEHKPLECWAAKSKQGDLRYGPTPLIAAMRCYVASKLGDTVQIPRELVP
jgi:hypothetical protein